METNTVKKLTVSQMALVYAGMYIGAGFISGQELWQFFACFGRKGLLGFLLSTVLMALVSGAVLSLVRDGASRNIGELLTLGRNRWLKRLVTGLQLLFLFGISVIMMAGGGTLVEEWAEIPVAAGSFLFAAVLAASAAAGVEGLVAVFSFVTPLVTVSALAVSGITLWRTGFLLQESGSVSPLIPNVLVGAVTYAAFNLFGVVGIQVSLEDRIPEGKTFSRGLFLGALLLFLMAGSMIGAIAAVPGAGAAAIPMLALSVRILPVLGFLNSLLIGFGMYMAAYGCITALLFQLQELLPAVRRHYRIGAAALCFLAAICSLAGFGSLVGMVYPVFGYLSMPFLLCVGVKGFRKN